jgi:hypothetical protein
MTILDDDWEIDRKGPTVVETLRKKLEEKNRKRPLYMKKKSWRKRK